MEVDEEGRQRLPQQGILELSLVIDKAQEAAENADYLVESVRKQQHVMEQGRDNELRQQVPEMQVPEMLRVSTGRGADAGETYTRPSSQSSRPVTQSGIRPGSRKDHSRQNTYSRVGLIPVPACMARMLIYKQDWLESTDSSVYFVATLSAWCASNIETVTIRWQPQNRPDIRFPARRNNK